MCIRDRVSTQSTGTWRVVMSGASISAADNAALRVNVGKPVSCPDSAAPAENAPAEEEGMKFDRDNEVMVMEGACTECSEMGETRMLLTHIPMFREIIVASFSCDHCGHRNESVDFAGAYQEQGKIVTLEVRGPDDLQRQVIKSDSCVVKIPEMEFEIQPNPDHKQGSFTTLQGVLNQARQGIEWLIASWKSQIPEQPENTDTILAVLNDLNPKIEQLETLMNGEIPFTFIMTDPGGNSYVSPASGLTTDPQIEIQHFDRSPEQNVALGFALQKDREYLHGEAGLLESDKPLENATVPRGASAKPKVQYDDSAWLSFTPNTELDESIMEFPSLCDACGATTVCYMHELKIPHFREVILMSATCDECGQRNTEIKPGGAVPALGRKCTLTVDCEEDLGRGVIKSHSAEIEIPEIELGMVPGTLGGVFTTVEGLLQKIRDQLYDTNPFGEVGDGRDTLAQGNDNAAKFKQLLDKLDRLIEAKDKFTVIVTDAMAASYIESPFGDASKDAKLVVVDYERSWDENEELGLNDMKTEGYENDHLCLLYTSPSPRDS
eukprot:TRINITY_DN12617_c0_g1_i4.p1 TRINITY_DN12617_c0_g1~~TRINITY_DN12617_c0_g1_i4.p1  ORF type:complete len:551 (+),score=123.41 TRINITY_DN12617_c0_g1_i4:88-1740(+)